jgi:hypothetical protein
MIVMITAKKASENPLNLSGPGKLSAIDTSDLVNP